ncbi:spore germination protein [Ammoniphilus sp. YIM 78166]|uniref:spore germination protein n=1 Tax=Ammoniphilus sp. YIM 78166 TaxID=1644106 RepID=UPI00106F5A6A|nr:spore germination protein [Ammoniphilus sp. YIM 78166]
MDSGDSDREQHKLTHNLRKNLETLKEVFKDSSDFIVREFTFAEESRAFLVYLDGMVNSDAISDYALGPLLMRLRLPLDNGYEPDCRLKKMLENNVWVTEVVETVDLDQVTVGILTGNAALFVERYEKAILLTVRGGTRRGVQEPTTESVIRGPREGFTENLRTNTALVRFKLKTTKLKLINHSLGEHTQTVVTLAYIDGLADPKVIEEVQKRLRDIEIDAVLETGYIEELIEDNPYSPFPQLQYTERPDTVTAQLLEGRFAIFVDGTPFVLIGPVTFGQFMQASEDFYERYMIGNFIRWLRYLFLFVSLLLPSIYIAVITYHHDMLPTNLLYSIAAAREAIPFPALIEGLIMEVSFEALREAGIRLPKTIGQAVSILGALVIGQAAVEAGIVSAPMVIIVSLTGIASFTIPRYNFAISMRILRFPLMILSGIFGLLGIVVGVMWVVIHLCHLRSFGVPYLSGIAPYSQSAMKDIFIRVPWWKMILRPRFYSRQENYKRMKKGMKPTPPAEENGGLS